MHMLQAQKRMKEWKKELVSDLNWIYVVNIDEIGIRWFENRQQSEGERWKHGNVSGDGDEDGTEEKQQTWKFMIEYLLNFNISWLNSLLLHNEVKNECKEVWHVSLETISFSVLFLFAIKSDHVVNDNVFFFFA